MSDDATNQTDASIGWLASRVALLAISFGILAAPIARVGKPDSPAFSALRDQKEPLAYAILGNSRPHVGLWPRLISESAAEAGLPMPRGHNFSVDGTDSVHHASFGTHGLLAAEPPPPVIVWAVDPLMFDASRKANRLEQLRRGDVAALARAQAPLELVLDVAAMQIFPPYRHRPLMLAKVEDKTEGIGKRLVKLQRAIGLVFEERPKPRTYGHEADGFEPFEVVADWEYRFYQRHGANYAMEYQKLVLSDWHESFARAFLAKARAAGVLVILLEMPESPYYRDKFASGAKHQTWRDRMKRLADQEGALFWNDAERYSSDKDFGDPGHMPRATAEDYSRAFGQKLARDPRVREALSRSGKAR
jgi:hypothetical protein